MRSTGKTLKFIAESVEAARSGQTVRIITTKTRVPRLHAMLAEHAGGSRVGDRWNFGPGSVEVVT